MKRVLPNRPGCILALLGFFVVGATLGIAGEKRVYVQYQAGAKGPVMAALKQAGGNVHYEFDSIDAVAVSLPEQALNGISRNPHVTLVEEDPIRKLASQMVPYGIDKVQARDVWDANRDNIIDAGAATGGGVKIGVIDSGVYTAHEDLVGLNINGWPTVSPGHVNNWDRDFLSHGTHVVGTIVAANNAKGVVGVAPGVSEIYMVKVFGDTGGWINSSSLLAAVETAVNHGSKIISMSLSGDIQSQTEKKGMDRYYNQGILMIAAAGNDGNTRTSYPAGYASVIAVAAVDKDNVVADFSQKFSAVELAAPGVGVLSTTSYIDETVLTVGGTPVPATHVEFSGIGPASGPLVYGGLGTSINADWAGKVVLVDRGTNSFYEKVMNVQNSGGVACIIANNVAGDLYATLGDGFSSSIPAAGITQADGAALKSGSIGVSTSVAVNYSPPQISGYQSWDGTSMATPHVSGVAALVWSANPGATNAQVREALVATALDLGASGRDSSYGYGLVQAKDAIEYLAGSNPPPPAELTITSSASVLKGKPGRISVSVTTNKTAAITVTTTPNIGTASTTGTSLSHTFQGSSGVTYTVLISATAGSETKTASHIVTP